MTLSVFRGLTGKVMFLVLGTGLALAVVLAHSYLFSRDMILEAVEKRARDLAVHHASRIESDLQVVSESTKTCAIFMERAQPDRVILLHMLEALVEGEGAVFGSTAAFEPYAFDSAVKAFAPYYFERDGGLHFVQLGTPEYDYFRKDWFRQPRKLRRPVWSEPYFDEGGGNEVMTTYSFPLFRGETQGGSPQFRGVLTADVSVKWLTKRLDSFRIYRTGYSFLISEKGKFIVFPKGQIAGDETIFALAQRLKDPNMAAVGRRMLKESSGFVDIGSTFTGRRSFLAFARIAPTGWSLGLVIPRHEILAEVVGFYQRNVVISVLAVGGMLVLATVIGAMITRPLRRMAILFGRVAKGDLDVELAEAQTRDELGVLAEAFRQMTVSLKKHIHELMETTAAKQRIESELTIAAQIQRSMLPSQYPAFPERCDFDIYAVMEPAREVGGDFYEFFLIDEDHLCLAVGDVSDKGVPASLFMAVTTFLLRVAADEGMSPDQILSLINRHLSKENDACNFVTIFCAILYLRTGDLTYSNAGHDAPLLYRPGKGVRSIPLPSAPPVGLMEDPSYVNERMVIEPGEIILAYTDGVTEALNEAQEFYSDERLKQLLTSLDSGDVTALVNAVLKDVERFRQGLEQSDDVTILAVGYRGKGKG